MESPYLQKAYQQAKGRGAVLGLAVEGDTAPSLKEFQVRHKATYPIALDAGNHVFGHFELSFPSTVLVDRNGTIRFIEEGFMPARFAATQKKFAGLMTASSTSHKAMPRRGP